MCVCLSSSQPHNAGHHKCVRPGRLCGTPTGLGCSSTHVPDWSNGQTFSALPSHNCPWSAAVCFNSLEIIPVHARPEEPIHTYNRQQHTTVAAADQPHAGDPCHVTNTSHTQSTDHVLYYKTFKGLCIFPFHPQVIPPPWPAVAPPKVATVLILTAPHFNPDFN